MPHFHENKLKVSLNGSKCQHTHLKYTLCKYYIIFEVKTFTIFTLYPQRDPHKNSSDKGIVSLHSSTWSLICSDLNTWQKAYSFPKNVCYTKFIRKSIKAVEYDERFLELMKISVSDR